jgi:Fic family protein
MNNITKVLELKKELDSLRPIDPIQEQLIMQKFRLDWNYHSNHLEGNSLTFGETKMLILHGITAGGKPLKDSLEITGHDEVIKLIEEVVKAQLTLTQSFIRELHSMLLKNSYEVEAQTADGKSTKKLVEIGKYKSSANHVKTKTGEIFHFAEPYEVQARMDNLMALYEKQITRTDVNPIILAAEFHYEFVRIHPFDDGNGRMARILMNFILMRFGFPPVIIKTEDKENYFFALRRADAGLSEFFVEYIAKNLVRSLEIMIAGAKGENIEEPDDLDKKIVLLEQKFNSEKSKLAITKTKEAVLRIYDDSVMRLCEAFITTRRKFDGFYLKKTSKIRLDKIEFEVEEIAKLRNVINENVGIIEISFAHRGFTKSEYLESGFGSAIEFVFLLGSYQVRRRPYAENSTITKNYDEQLTNEEIAEIMRIEKESHYKLIEEKLKN